MNFKWNHQEIKKSNDNKINAGYSHDENANLWRIMTLWRRRMGGRTIPAIIRGFVGFQVDQFGDGVGRGVRGQGSGAAIAGTGRDWVPHYHRGSERLVSDTKFGTLRNWSDLWPSPWNPFKTRSTLFYLASTCWVLWIFRSITWFASWSTALLEFALNSMKFQIIFY